MGDVKLEASRMLQISSRFGRIAFPIEAALSKKAEASQYCIDASFFFVRELYPVYAFGI